MKKMRMSINNLIIGMWSIYEDEHKFSGIQSSDHNFSIMKSQRPPLRYCFHYSEIKWDKGIDLKEKLIISFRFHFHSTDMKLSKKMVNLYGNMWLIWYGICKITMLNQPWAILFMRRWSTRKKARQKDAGITLGERFTRGTRLCVFSMAKGHTDGEPQGVWKCVF